MFLKTIFEPAFVKDIEARPILEILLGNESTTPSFIKTTKLSASIIEFGNSFSEEPMVIVHPVKLIADPVVL